MHKLPDSPDDVVFDPAETEGPVDAGVEKYLHYIAHVDLPLPQKIELLEALAVIMQNFVDRAFGEDPVQQARQPEGKSAAQDAAGKVSVVGSKLTTPQTIRPNSQRVRAPKGRRARKEKAIDSND